MPGPWLHIEDDCTRNTIELAPSEFDFLSQDSDQDDLFKLDTRNRMRTLSSQDFKPKTTVRETTDLGKYMDKIDDFDINF